MRNVAPSARAADLGVVDAGCLKNVFERNLSGPVVDAADVDPDGRLLVGRNDSRFVADVLDREFDTDGIAGKLPVKSRDLKKIGPEVVLFRPVLEPVLVDG